MDKLKMTYELRVTSLDVQITSWNLQVTSSNSRITSWNPRVTSSRDQKHELQDLGNSRVGKLKAQVDAIKPRF